jgi:hypothetical protein
MKLMTTAAIGLTLLCSVSAPALAQSSKDSCARLQQVTEQNRTLQQRLDSPSRTGDPRPQ